MIRISVHLISAQSGTITELARMDIANDPPSGSHALGNYIGMTYVGRSKERLDKRTVSKSTHVMNWRREQFHVWNLVCAMLIKMGYTQGHK